MSNFLAILPFASVEELPSVEERGVEGLETWASEIGEWCSANVGWMTAEAYSRVMYILGG